MIYLNKILKKEIGISPNRINQLYGGDINLVYHCIFDDKDLVIKVNDSNKFPQMFEKEKLGLDLLSRSYFKIPEVISVGTFKEYNYIIIEYIKQGNNLNWDLFGENLAKLHRITNDKFGLDHNNYIGSLVQNNSFDNEWSSFYSNNRILNLTKIVRNKKLIDKKDCNLIDQLCRNLKNIIPKAKPSLIHGDLWSGNLLCNENKEPVLIDPAAYYGHPEMDLAMLSLFGNYPESALKKYKEVYPLENGFNERKEVHQLYPLLVHLILFGRQYYNSIKKILLKFS